MPEGVWGGARGAGMLGSWGKREKIETTVIAKSIKYN